MEFVIYSTVISIVDDQPYTIHQVLQLDESGSGHRMDNQNEPEQKEINHIISSILNKITMSNHITSINSLINQETNEDEDRKFLRAAAEAIVATSMNNQIDPTILELLKRIQYASSSERTGPSAGSSAGSTVNLNTSGSFNFLNNGTVQPNRAHFPSFNLNYFDSLNNDSNHSSTNSTTTHEHHSSASTSASTNSHNWNNFHSPSLINNPSPINHNSTNLTNTPLSIASTTTPPSAIQTSVQTPNSISSLHERNDSIGSLNNPEKPFVCNDCSLSFRRSSDLRRHQRAHLPILPHICQLCGKGFARKDALKRHSDTLTCKRNREKLISSGGDLESILAQTKK